MAWTADDIDRLKTAIASGALSVAYADRTVSYRSLAEMQAILSMMQAEVAGPAHSTHRLAATRKGT